MYTCTGVIQYCLCKRVALNVEYNLTINEVESAINQIAIKKATGPDGLGVRYLKLLSPVICSTLCSLMNESIRTSVFPALWKKAAVTALHKGGNACELGNYRPISVLCVISKILESHVQRHLCSYMGTHGLLCDDQSGFRTRHSCETCLLNIGFKTLMQGKWWDV